MSKQLTPKVDKPSIQPKLITTTITGDPKGSVPRFEKAPQPPPKGKK